MTFKAYTLKSFITRYTVTIILLCLSSMPFAHAAPAFVTRDGQCPFCIDEVLNSQSVYQTPHAITLLNYKPSTYGHLMVIPRKCVTRFENLDANELQEIHTHIKLAASMFAQHLGANDYVIVQKNGLAAGQYVEHLHIHLIPIKNENVADDTPLFNAIDKTFSMHGAQRDTLSLEEMQVIIADLKIGYEHVNRYDSMAASSGSGISSRSP